MQVEERGQVVTRSMHPGMLLGDRYRLDDLLTDIGGARFWRATDQVLDRSVAVHTVSTDDPRAETLLTAARQAATITDPHVLKVLDCDATESSAWVVNEWGRGAPLDVLIAEQGLPSNRAVWFVSEIADAMSRAHARGLAHGRLSPENVMLTESGSVKIIGFATDAALHPVGAGESGNYPGADPIRRDVRDLGALLYCALVGSWPGASVSSVRAAHRDSRGPLRARQIRAGVPRELDAICDRVLSTHRTHDRIDSSRELLAALSKYAGTAPPPEAVPLESMPEWDATEPTAPLPAEITEISSPPTTIAPAADPFDWTEGMTDEHDIPAPPAPQPQAGPDRPLFAPEGTRRTPKPGAPAPTEPSILEPAPPAPAPELIDSGWPFAQTSVETEFEEAPPRNWLRGPLLVGLALALVFAGLLIWKLTSDPATPSGSQGPDKQSSGGASAQIEIQKVRDFDPEGDPQEENPDQAKFAIDGDPSTGWSTVTYKRRPDLGGLKSGVGLILDLGTIQRVSRVELDLVGSPTSVSILAAPTDSGAPDSIDALVTAGEAKASTEANITLDTAVRTRYLVLWLTKLPAVGGGYRGAVNEVRAWS